MEEKVNAKGIRLQGCERHFVVEIRKEQIQKVVDPHVKVTQIVIVTALLSVALK